MIRFEVEHEIAPLRFAYVYCPKCSNKFDAMRHGTTEQRGHIHDSIDLRYGIFHCPHCQEVFTTRGEEIETIET